MNDCPWFFVLPLAALALTIGLAWLGFVKPVQRRAAGGKPKHAGRHRKDPLYWDWVGAWDGTVILADGRWIRYRDRNGEHKDVVA
jgi:hypothetical protein